MRPLDVAQSFEARAAGGGEVLWVRFDLANPAVLDVHLEHTRAVAVARASGCVGLHIFLELPEVMRRRSLLLGHQLDLV